MKKFLFTLAALLMVGTAFADNYLYVEDVTITEDQIGKNVTLDVKAHLENYVSAWRFYVTAPEGVTVKGYKTTAAMTLPMIDEFGDESSVVNALNVSPNKDRVLSACTVGDYDENGNYCGVPHWAPGDYVLIQMVISVSADYAGGDVTIGSDFSSGGNTKYQDQCIPAGSPTDWRTFHITMPGGVQDPVVAPEPTIGYDENGNVVATAEGHTTVLMLNGQEEANIVGQPYELVQTWEPQTLNFYAYTVAGADEDENSAIVGPFVVEVPALQPTAAPAPVIGLDDNGDVIATAEGHTVQLYLNGNPVDQPYELPAATWETQVLSFTAVTQPGEHETATESAEPFVVTIDPLQPTAAPTPVISTNDEGQIIATCDGPNTVQLYLNGEPVDQPYTLPAQTNVEQVLSFTATTLPGEHETATSTAEPYVVTIPAAEQPLPYCERPSCAYSITALETVTVTITNNQPGATVYWSYVDPVTGETVQGSFTGEQDQIIVDGVGQYTITCYAAMEGYQNSPDGGCFFEILPNDAPPTAIDELVNGKTVAGVRYFNMAGQEMQEANGMTIVVTTYTDGTTSAVKVMK